jgi:uncharacterized protein (DUF934 family)
MLIRLEHGRFFEAPDAFLALGEDELAPQTAQAVLLDHARFLKDGAAFLDEGRKVGVRLEPADLVEDLAYDLPRLALVALHFPRFRDGRPYSSAVLLRRRYRFAGEIRAVGDVLREQAFEMVRCGFDGFVVSDGADPLAFATAAERFSHVYQASADGRPPAFNERMTTRGL